MKSKICQSLLHTMEQNILYFYKVLNHITSSVKESSDNQDYKYTTYEIEEIDNVLMIG